MSLAPARRRDVQRREGQHEVALPATDVGEVDLGLLRQRRRAERASIAPSHARSSASSAASSADRREADQATGSWAATMAARVTALRNAAWTEITAWFMARRSRFVQELNSATVAAAAWRR